MPTLVHPKEKAYFAICLAVSVLLYILLIVSLVGIVYIVLFGLLALVANGLLSGAVRGNAVRVSEKQFPELYAMGQRLSAQLGLDSMPAIYVMQAGGLLNAFAARFLGRNYVVLFSDVLELAYAQGSPQVAFVLCHELAHVQRRHLVWRLLLAPSLFVPFLGSAYSRACEYTCDRYGAFYEPQGAVGGLLVLAAGKRLYSRVDVTEYAGQRSSEDGFWVWLAEILSTHPNLTKRVGAVADLTANQPALVAGASAGA